MWERMRQEIESCFNYLSPLTISKDECENMFSDSWNVFATLPRRECFHFDEWWSINIQGENRSAVRWASGNSNRIESLTIHFSVVSLNVCDSVSIFLSFMIFRLWAIAAWCALSNGHLAVTDRPSRNAHAWPNRVCFTALEYEFHSDFHFAQKVANKNHANKKTTKFPWSAFVQHLKINLTSLQHDFLHLNDMWRKFCFRFDYF